ncbi:poly(A) polymerase [Candidatus Liberibacter solanacearum]|uniref:tRNA nucleotidyltransferase n=1 Tax=Candidatus Liberibacter solanacearum TaxID=556287 RepID=A0A095A0K5_9HYPH|nr:CCA tRNA nucleotidyltransferase [Candidatus Liberibacter solanacearum]KGB27646.1 poly(A) polymerase [Candidatus Liberibacter solanacearum]KJZ81692.1 tRNA nucleotidyltransferase [Candidatus Liberibacter solanacearum]KQC48955.1 poly(A) polymerase [Candidatus Liberibacter solanacearum]
MVSIAHHKWFCDPDLIHILSLLNQGKDKSCIVGGAVRNSLMNLSVQDIDIATTILPKVIMEIFSQTSYKVIPTGIPYGTVTIIKNKKYFDITTLRSDLITDGRHAKVVFTHDWKADSLRRDFTINALYADQAGRVIDYVGGLNDLKNRTIKFIGNAHHRILEDYLRILRFFRFFAHYGQHDIDPDGLAASIQAKAGLKILSSERIWLEIKKILEAKNPLHAIMYMHNGGIFKEIFLNVQDSSIDQLSQVIEGEKVFGWEIDPLLRFIVLIPLREKQSIISIAKKLSLPREIKYFLLACIGFNIEREKISIQEMKRLFYLYGREIVVIKLKIFLSLNYKNLDREEICHIRQIILDIEHWIKPLFPLRGDDVLKYGIPPGKNIGNVLSYCEKEWIKSSFKLSYEDLLHLLQKFIKFSSNRKVS